MPLVPGDIIHVWFRCNYEGQEYQLHHNYRCESGNSTAGILSDLDQILTEINQPLTNNSFLSRYLDVLAGDVTVMNVNAQRVTPSRSQYVTQTINIDGRFIGDSGTGNLAAGVELFTDFAGRDQLSVKHIGPLPADAAYAAGLLVGAYVVKLNDLATAMLAPISIASGASTLNPVVWHAPNPSADILVGRRIGDTVRTMHRRTLRLGI